MIRALLILPFLLLCLSVRCQSLLTIGGKQFFLNGANIAWNNYGWDFGDNSAGFGGGNGYDPVWWENTFTDIENYGGNCVRIWIHCKGEHNPLFDASHRCIGLNTNFYNNLDDLLQRAETHNLMVIFCLFDFHITDVNRHAIIKDTSKTKAYITNALIPMVQRYQNQCNLIAWEVINEPEWIMGGIPGGGGHDGGPVTITEMQRFVGLCASAIHTNCTKLVTVGSASIKWNSDLTPAIGNYWSDTDLKTAAYGDNNAYLDFYQIHYYDWMLNGNNVAPYNRTKTSWGFDKPTLVGETGNEGYYSYQQQVDYSYSNGYAGCLIWAYESGGAASWADFNSEMKNFRDNNTTVVDFSCSLLPTKNTVSGGNFSVTTFTESGGEILIKLERIHEAKLIRILDLKGIVQSEIPIDGEEEIRFIQNWKSGLYLIVLETNDGLYYRKMIVN